MECQNWMAGYPLRAPDGHHSRNRPTGGAVEPDRLRCLAVRPPQAKRGPPGVPVGSLRGYGVLRDRLGTLEDQFFASVFLGSGLLFVASLDAWAALSGVLAEGMVSARIRSLNSDNYYLVRQLASTSLNIFGVKMAGVFIMSTSTIVLR